MAGQWFWQYHERPARGLPNGCPVLDTTNHNKYQLILLKQNAMRKALQKKSCEKYASKSGELAAE